MGWKTQWADGRVRFNGAIFFQEWDDFQYSFLGENGLTNIRNAGTRADQRRGSHRGLGRHTTSCGCPWAPPGWTRSSREDFCQAIDEDPCSEENFAKDGTRLPVTPTFKGNVIARYSFRIGNSTHDVQG